MPDGCRFSFSRLSWSCSSTREARAGTGTWPSTTIMLACRAGPAWVVTLGVLAVVHPSEPLKPARRVQLRMVAGQRGRRDFSNARDWKKSPDRKWSQLEVAERLQKQAKQQGRGDDAPLSPRRARRREWWAANSNKPRIRASQWRSRAQTEVVEDDPYGEAPGKGALVEKFADADETWADLARAATDGAHGEARADFFSGSTFVDMGVSPAVASALSSLGFEQASHVQALAYKWVLHGHNCLIADRTGSGKTLAYLAPLAQRIGEQETLHGVTGEPGCPLVLVVTPTSELATQVLSTARALSRAGVPFRSAVITGDHPWRTQRDTLTAGVELLVCTPGRLASHVKAGTLRLDNIQAVVLDEVDVLLHDPDFEEPWGRLRAGTDGRASFIFVTATLPEATETLVRSTVPALKAAKGPGLHRAVPGVRHVLVECAGATPEKAFDEKVEALSAALEQCGHTRTIVFCNAIEECRQVENQLLRRDRRGARYRVLAYHAALTQQRRKAHLQEFVDGASGEHLVLVATDRASRGIDFSCAQHVVLFSFPRRGDEWLRRVGRVGRGATGKGLVTSFVLPYQAMRARKMLHKTLGQDRLWIG